MNAIKLSLVALFFFVISQNHCCGRIQKHVYIRNDLSGGRELTFHCKSKDDDLGFTTLAPGAEWGFGFHPVFLGNTLFYCTFQWVDGQKHFFDVYNDQIHRYSCNGCHWSIRLNGTCLSADSITEPTCYDWKI